MFLCSETGSEALIKIPDKIDTSDTFWMLDESLAMWAKEETLIAYVAT